jgi:hypothetical protein
LPITYRGRDLMLYRVGGDTAGASAVRRLAVIVAHLVWLAMLVGAAIGGMAAGWSARKRQRRSTVATPLR